MQIYEASASELTIHSGLLTGQVANTCRAEWQATAPSELTGNMLASHVHAGTCQPQ